MRYEQKAELQDSNKARMYEERYKKWRKKKTNEMLEEKKKQLVNRKEVNNWLGNSYEEWIHNLIYRLVNKKVSTTDIRVEMKQMYKDYKENK